MNNFKSFPDLELVDLLKSGNPHAFNELFHRYNAILITFSYYRLRDKEVARDMLQTIFADLWENRTDINIPGKFESYIFTILRNRIFNHYRREQVSQRYLDNFQKYIDNTEDNTDHLIRYNDLAQLIAIEIAALPDGLRLVFELSRNTTMTRKEIAAELSLSEEGVKTRMHRALTILKKRLGDGIYLL